MIVYGKILSINKGGSLINYTYDAAGNRITKKVGGKTTIYVRDASGNVMSVYENIAGSVLKKTEDHIYGSSRLGIIGSNADTIRYIDLGPGYTAGKMDTLKRGTKSFEISNHLGNVLATISDRKFGILLSTSDSLIDHFEADILSAQDYHPKGIVTDLCKT